MYSFGKDCKCAKCSKNIVVNGLWMYKIVTNSKTNYYCSYSCYRKAGGDSGKFTKRARRNK